MRLRFTAFCGSVRRSCCIAQASVATLATCVQKLDLVRRLPWSLRNQFIRERTSQSFACRLVASDADHCDQTSGKSASSCAFRAGCVRGARWFLAPEDRVNVIPRYSFSGSFALSTLIDAALLLATGLVVNEIERELCAKTDKWPLTRKKGMKPAFEKQIPQQRSKLICRCQAI